MLGLKYEILFYMRLGDREFKAIKIKSMTLTQDLY